MSDEDDADHRSPITDHRTRRDAFGNLTSVSRSDDEVRLLARASERGYVHTAALALRNEPEAISESEQELLSKRVREAERKRAREEWKRANARIADAVNDFRERSGHVAPGVVSGTRAVLRAAEQVGRKLQA
jgi:ElaB/YqjD/DUF883 family membrane-anchored ribosome-binding protein